MPPASSSPRLLPSILDRLTDAESMGGQLAGYDHRQMFDAVRADLEDLLNTRQTLLDVPDEFVETRRSVATYGLPDLTRYGGSSSDAETLARVIADVVVRNEPRLKNVRVKITTGGGYLSRSVRFHIDAQLNMDPAPTIGFETVLELTTGHATVTPREPGG
jgi:type VI secretion system lysozyme-like protein